MNIDSRQICFGIADLASYGSICSKARRIVIPFVMEEEVESVVIPIVEVVFTHTMTAGMTPS